MDYKKLYDTLLENKDLFEVFEDATGEWLIDKKEFIKQQKEIESFSKDIKLNAFDLLENEEDINLYE